VLFDRAGMAALAVLLAALVWYRHSANIARLRAGTEPRIGGKKG
jgi:glycerol-3-phosphate acyltransferase PlsY